MDDPKLLDKMTAAWRNDIFKRGNAGFRHFGMANGVAQRLSDGSMSGPLTLGYRLRSSKTPADYSMLVYEKGKQYTFTELSNMLKKAGFTDCKATHSFGYYSVITATK